MKILAWGNVVEGRDLGPDAPALTRELLGACLGQKGAEKVAPQRLGRERKRYGGKLPNDNTANGLPLSFSPT
jgi:hypothetical protein